MIPAFLPRPLRPSPVWPHYVQDKQIKTEVGVIGFKRAKTGELTYLARKGS